MVSRRHRARFFSRAAHNGVSRLTHKHKPPPLRYLLLILLTLGGLAGWSFAGGQWMASLNPDLRMRFHLFTPALDAWITPPDYIGSPPIIVATPAGMRFDGNTIDVLAGSTFTAHLAEGIGGAPTLLVNGREVAFSDDTNGGFEIAQPIHDGDTISIRQGWQEMASWHIRIVADSPPRVAFTESPSVMDRKVVRLSYQASDDYGVSAIVARIVPVSASPRADSGAVDIPLAKPGAKNIHRVTFEDLSSYPWAGNSVQIKLIATNLAGRSTESAPVTFAVPARVFSNSVARALIEERERLMKNPDDENTRNEAANVMAGIAHVPGIYRGDTVVLMTLRSGAVRLVLDHNPDVAASVEDLLWQSAVRIEDGAIGVAEQRLRDIQSQLADAIDRKAPAPEIESLVDRLREAFASYVSTLSSRPIAASGSQNLSQAAGFQTNMLAPKDIEKMLENIRDLSISGAADEAHDKLMELGQKIETLHERASSFAEEMQRRARALNYPEGAHDSAEHIAPNF